jgi:hypothetical protein
VVKKSLPQLTPAAEPDKIDPDWTSQFTKSACEISNEEMQRLWANILAGEANKPGSFSKRTLKIMSDLSKAEAEQFSTICRYACNWGPLIFDFKDEIYTKNNISFESVMTLTNAGLIDTIGVGSYVMENLPKISVVNYFGRPLFLTIAGKQLVIGQVRFTRSGEELSGICEAKPVDGFFDWLLKKWFAQGAMEPLHATEENPKLRQRAIRADGTEVISPFPIEKFKEHGKSF